MSCVEKVEKVRLGDYFDFLNGYMFGYMLLVSEFGGCYFVYGVNGVIGYFV